MNVKSVGGFVALVLLAGVTQAQQTIVPGRSVGRIFLGMPRADVWKILGKPTYNDAPHGTLILGGRSYAVDVWENVSDAQRTIAISRRGKVRQIEIALAHTATAATFAQIRREHPRMRASLYRLGEEAGAGVYADDISKGICWVSYVHHEDDFPVYYLPSLAPDKVIVHPVGRRVLPDEAGGWSLQEPHPEKDGHWMRQLRAWFAGGPHDTIKD